MADIYLLIQGQQKGPYSEDQVRQSLAHGQIKNDVLAWREGLAEWIRVEAVLGEIHEPVAEIKSPHAKQVISPPVLSVKETSKKAIRLRLKIIGWSLIGGWVLFAIVCGDYRDVFLDGIRTVCVIFGPLLVLASFCIKPSPAETLIIERRIFLSIALIVVAVLIISVAAFIWHESHREGSYAVRRHGGVHTDMGLALLEKGKLDEAAVQFRMALENYPNSVDAHRNLGAVFLQKGQVDMAMIQFEEALETNPNDALTRNKLGIAFLQKGRIDDAISEFKKALILKPDDGEAQTNLADAEAYARSHPSR